MIRMPQLGTRKKNVDTSLMIHRDTCRKSNRNYEVFHTSRIRDADRLPIVGAIMHGN